MNRYSGVTRLGSESSRTLTVSSRSAVLGADSVQQLMDDLVLEPVADLSAGPRRTHPALLPKHPKRLGYRIFRPSERRGEITDADPRRPVQAQQDLQPVGIRQQIETQGPAGGVDVGQRRRRTLDQLLFRGFLHC